MDLFENDYHTAVGMQDDAFLFMQFLPYKIILQFHCIFVWLDKFKYSYPECNAKVTIWQWNIWTSTTRINAQKYPL